MERRALGLGLIIYICMHAINVLCSGGQLATTRKACWCGPTDIIFALHTSSSSSGFEKLKDFVGRFVGTCDLGPRGVRIGLLTFANTTHEEFKVGAYSDKATLLGAINNTRYYLGETRTDLALTYAREDGFAGSTGAKKVLILLTEHLADRPNVTYTEAAKLHTDNVKVFAIGAGGDVDEIELLKIASDPRYMHTVPHLSNLNTIEVSLGQRVCEISCLYEPPQVTHSTTQGKTTYTSKGKQGAVRSPTITTRTHHPPVHMFSTDARDPSKDATDPNAVALNIRQSQDGDKRDSSSVIGTFSEEGIHMIACIAVGSILATIVAALICTKICENNKKNKVADGRELATV